MLSSSHYWLHFRKHFYFKISHICSVTLHTKIGSSLLQVPANSASDSSQFKQTRSQGSCNSKMAPTAVSPLHFAVQPAFSVNKDIIQINELQDDNFVLQMQVEHVMLMIFGGAFLGMLVMIATLFLKLLVNLISSGVEQGIAVETDFLLPKQVISFTYGTCDDQEDVESGEGSCSSTEDLYDWKICVICYDQQKCCLFVPCGHCVTCETCAKRIIVGENKTCPICRCSIRKVKKVLMS